MQAQLATPASILRSCAVFLTDQRIGTLAALLETISHGNGDDRDPSSFLLRVYKNSEQRSVICACFIQNTRRRMAFQAF